MKLRGGLLSQNAPLSYDTFENLVWVNPLQPIPEPSVEILLLTASLGLVTYCWRRKPTHN